jgi:hypothetical protein
LGLEQFEAEVATGSVAVAVFVAVVGVEVVAEFFEVML